MISAINSPERILALSGIYPADGDGCCLLCRIPARTARAAGCTGYPYICWLVSGIIPWFFFSDALPSASNCLLEYSYLVKKVVFKISVLPIVKVISSLFVHLFFIVFAILIFALMGKLPPVQIIQIGYYTFAVICLVVVLSYLTCSITPFFRDFGQIINVILNVGMWATPILWDTTTIPNIPNWLNQPSEAESSVLYCSGIS